MMNLPALRDRAEVYYILTPVDRGCAIGREERDKLGSPFGRRSPRLSQFGTATPASERIGFKQSFRGGKLDVSHRVAHSFQQPMCPEARIEASPKRR
jgi:hypothetical protein